MIQYINGLGGSSTDNPLTTAIDSAGNLYIAGQTTSPNYPAMHRLVPYQNSVFGETFVAKVDATGSQTVFSTIIGIGKPSVMAADASGDVFVAGVDASSNIPATPGAFSASGPCYLLKLPPDGSNFLYAARFSCDNAATITDIEVDATGAAYLVGTSFTLNTTPGAFNPGPSNSGGGFTMKVGADGKSVGYATYLPSGALPSALALDAQGNAFITGNATLPSFTPTVTTLPHEDPAAASPALATADVFVLELSANGSQVPFSTLFGGYGADQGHAIALGNDGSIYVTGAAQTSTGFGPATPFPTTANAFYRIPDFPSGFLVRLAPAGNALLFSTFIPGASNGRCLRVLPDGTADVLADWQLVRVAADGTASLNSMRVSSNVPLACAQNGGHFGIIQGDTAIVRSGLLPAPPAGNPNVSISVVEADVPGAQQLSLDAGALTLRPYTGAGSATIHLTSGGNSASGIAFSLGPPSVTVSPDQSIAPGDITVSSTANETGTAILVIFVPGVQNGLIFLPVSIPDSLLSLALDPYPLTMSMPNSSAGPVTQTFHLTATALADAFGATAPVAVPFTIMKQWSGGLNVTPLQGVTPSDITFTVDPTGLPNGSSIFAFPLGSTSFNIPFNTYVLTVQVGPEPVQPPSVVAVPNLLTLQIGRNQSSASAVIHLDSSADPVNFLIDPPPAGVTVSPMGGTTPADLTVTASADSFAAGTSTSFGLTIHYGTGTQPLIYFVRVTRSSPVYPPVFFTAGLGQNYVATALNSTTPTSYIAPGALFSISVTSLNPLPSPAQNAPNDSYVDSLAGLTFKINGVAVPLRSYENGAFIAQMPATASGLPATLDGFDSAGNWIGTANVNIAPGGVAPQYPGELMGAFRARKQDGSLVDASNPAQPGDILTVQITGQGPLTPPIADGRAATPGVAYNLVAPLTVSVGGLSATVVSAAMSTTDAGIMNISFAVPDVIPGDQFVVVALGNRSTAPLPIKVSTTGPPPPGRLGAMSHLASGGGWETTFTLVNTGAGTAQTQLNLFDDSGAPLLLPFTSDRQPGSITSSSASNTIEANGSLTLQTSGSDDMPGNSGSAQLLGTSGVSGFAIFKNKFSGQEAPVPLQSRNAKAYDLVFDQTSGSVLGVALQNLSNQAANVSYTNYDDTGGIISQGSITIAGEGHTSFVLSDRNPETAGRRGYVEFSTPASGSIGVLGIHATAAGAVSSVPALSDQTSGGTVPHLAVGAGWTTTVVLLNRGGDAAVAHVRFKDVNGSALPLGLTFPQTGESIAGAQVDQTIPAHGSVIVETSDMASPPAGGGSISLASLSKDVSGYVMFRYGNGQEASVAFSAPTPASFIVPFDHLNGVATGVAIANFGVDAPVAITVRDEHGNQIGLSSIFLPAGGQTSFLLSDHYPVTANQRGTVELTPANGASINAIGLRASSTLTFTMLPPFTR